jgi:Fe2+ or Zn2+ uptake regulation protein
MDDTLREDLRRAGKRITPQRILIMDMIREGGGHLGADEIHRRAKAKAPSLSLSTVYRTISLLKEAGLIEELHLDDEHHHYELKGDRSHHHLICQGCGRIIEFDCPFSQAFLCDLGEQHEFQISSVQLNLTGYCSQCRED